MAGMRTYLIPQSDVSRVLSMQQAVAAVEAAFRAYGEGKVQMPPKSYLLFEKGDLRVMPSYEPDLGLAAVKNVNVHPGNTALPSVMATISLFDPETGYPLAIMDGTLVTAMRTGAAGGVAAKYLARADSRVVCLVGAGRQAQTQLAALMVTVPTIERALFCDVNRERAEELARQSAARHGIEAAACPLDDALAVADIVVTVTPVRKPIVMRDQVRPGTHINAIGADAPGKQELDAAIIRSARVVIDEWEQASHGGEINVPVSQGLFGRDDLHGELGQVVCGRTPGRQSDDDITVFDSTGLAIQDLACAALVYRAVMADGAAARLVTLDFLS